MTIQIEQVYRLLDQISVEALEFVEVPPDNFQTEFGFGRANGILAAVRRMRALLDDHMEAQAAREDQFERDYAEGRDTDNPNAP